jgi:hypothetical protein
MTTAIIVAFRFATCWSLPAVLADADFIIAHAMFSTVYRAHLVGTCVYRPLLLDAPTFRAEAVAFDAHPISSAIWNAFSLIESSAVLQLAMFAMPKAFTNALLQCAVPFTIG